MNRAILIGVVLLAIFAIAFAVVRSQSKASPTDECTPEGGLRCVDGHIHVCQGGTLTAAGACPGGCKDEDGIVRCTDEAGSLLAPAGAGCVKGMAICGVDGPALMVCENGVMTRGADCPGGCREASEGGGLYCFGEDEELRFAPGFPCPAFGTTADEYACGPDGKTLLACKDGVLATHDVSCGTCRQRRSGQLTCLNDTGDMVDPKTGDIAQR